MVLVTEKFEDEGQEFVNFLRSLDQAVKGQNIVLVKECFFYLRFLRSNKLEQLEFKLEKVIGI